MLRFRKSIQFITLALYLGALAGCGGGGGGGNATGSSQTTTDLPAGWLYTSAGKIQVSDGKGAGSTWMGRGVNIDDLFLCGYNNTLGDNMALSYLQSEVNGLMQDWRPNFVRVSLYLSSYPIQINWMANTAGYASAMIDVINGITANPDVYVLVTLRSDASMIKLDLATNTPDATGLPSDSNTTPNPVTLPNGTDDTYVALVDTFANTPNVLFGISNEPGGNTLSNADIAAAMTHAVAVIRAEEDRLGVPHHLVSVQGNNWTSDISFYADTPIPYDNVVYEIHGYPPTADTYTYASLPVILGEYGNLTADTQAGFYADVEAKQIPNLAWTFAPFSDCMPDLLNVTLDASKLEPTAWGAIVQNYLLTHAK
jgi:hypothetical protein